jgi:predicted DNA-binding protein
MEMKDFAVPGITVIFAAGVSFASFESSAQEVEELNDRLIAIESNVGKQEVVDVKIEGIEKRLDKMEDIVQKMLDIQQRQAVNIAQICQATNANCSSGN